MVLRARSQQAVRTQAEHPWVELHLSWVEQKRNQLVLKNQNLRVLKNQRLRVRQNQSQ